MSLKFRSAGPEDVAIILRFIRDLAVYERLEHKVVATEGSLRETLFGERRYGEVIFAEFEGQPVGFALFFHNYSTFLAQPGIYLEDLFVDPAYRGRGIGKALLINLAAIAKARGCGRLEWSVLKWNEPSIEFYKAMGAKPLDEWVTFRADEESLERLAARSLQDQTMA